MKQEERQLLYCLAAYRLGRRSAEAAGLDRDQWPRLYTLARIHKLSAVAFETLWRLADFCAGNDVLARTWQRETILETAGQTRRTSRLLQVTQALDRNGIDHAVVKGAVCRELYPAPDLRPSGDEDILIHPTDRETCALIFREAGLQLLETWEGDPVTHWGDPQTGLHIELHTSLTPGQRPVDKQLDAYFTAQLSHTVRTSVQNSTLRTLCPTAHFLFLVCHALKHFISGGFGIRTVCDVVTFAGKYAAEIDRGTVYAWLELARGRVFLDQLFAIGEAFLEFDVSAAGWTYSTPPDPDDMLADILDAGIYGQSTMSRRHSAGMVLQAAETESNRPGMRSSLFPARDRMEGKYPVLKRAPALLPACWVHRLGKYAVEVIRTRKSGNSPLESVAMGKKRTEMMVKYGVLPKDQSKN